MTATQHYCRQAPLREAQAGTAERQPTHPILTDAGAPLLTAAPKPRTVALPLFTNKASIQSEGEGPNDLPRGVEPNKGEAARLCAGAAGPAPPARSNAPQIKRAAARSASVIIIMQALRGARDSGERATRAARAPSSPPHYCPSPHNHNLTSPITHQVGH